MTRADDVPNLNSSKGDLVTDWLREMITQGQFAPGTSLRQRELADRLTVSATPIREALRRLESEGLVTHDAHRGSRVALVNPVEQEENYRILAALEPLATSLAAEKIGNDDLREIRSYERRFALCGEDSPELEELNRAFHFRIYECARSPLLLSLMRLLWRSFPRGPQIWRAHVESLEQHASLVAALEARDADRAAEITRRHVLGSIDLMRRQLDRERRRKEL